MEKDPFNEWYPQVRSLYEEAVGHGVSPMAMFGMMLGVIAQEFKQHASRDEFIDFLAEMSAVSWPKESSDTTKPVKKKPKLTIVH